eukprot:1161688-Pelagomonas_calceolata.AAC.7
MRTDCLVEKITQELQGRLPSDKRIDDGQKAEIRSLAEAKLQTLGSKDVKVIRSDQPFFVPAPSIALTGPRLLAS